MMLNEPKLSIHHNKYIISFRQWIENIKECMCLSFRLTCSEVSLVTEQQEVLVQKESQVKRIGSAECTAGNSFDPRIHDLRNKEIYV